MVQVGQGPAGERQCATLIIQVSGYGLQFCGLLLQAFARAVRVGFSVLDVSSRVQSKGLGYGVQDVRFMAEDFYDLRFQRQCFQGLSKVVIPQPAGLF